MSEHTAPKLSKWPFFAGDLLLLGLAAWIVNHYPYPLSMWPLLCLVACVGVGAWLAVTPFLVEYQALLKFAEADALTSAVEQINSVRAVANQISFATAQWQVVQEHSSRTVEEARGIAEKMAEEAKAFADFMAKANDREKAHLRLEVDKLRRGEQEWLQVLVVLLDHAFALYQAGLRSGQPNLIAQLTSYQSACREIVRRVGLVAFEAKPDDVFNAETHQLPDADAKPLDGGRVTATLASGYTYQGQLIRRVVVQLTEPSSAAPTAAEEAPEEQLSLGSS